MKGRRNTTGQNKKLMNNSNNSTVVANIKLTKGFNDRKTASQEKFHKNNKSRENSLERFDGSRSKSP